MDRQQEPFERSLGEVVADVFRDGSELIRQEIELAKTEIRENLSRIAKDGIGVAIGAVLALVGMLALVAAAILGLAEVVPAWLAALIVGGVLALIGLIMVMAGLRGIREGGIAPERTMETLREDARMVKEKFA